MYQIPGVYDGLGDIEAVSYQRTVFVKVGKA